MNTDWRVGALLCRSQIAAVAVLLSLLLPASAAAQKLEIAFDPSSIVAAELGVQDSEIVSSNPIATDGEGNVYVSLDNGPSIVKATPVGELSLAFSASQFLSAYASANPGLALPQIDSISDFVIDDRGTLYLATLPEQNILAVYSDGSVEVLLDRLAEDDGEFQYRSKLLVLNPDGDLYLGGLSSDRIYQITGDDPFSLLAGPSTLFDGSHVGISNFAFAPDGTAIIVSYRGLFTVSQEGSAKPVFEQNRADQEHRFYYGFLPQIATDKIGNIYFWSGHYGPGYYLNSFNVEDEISANGEEVMLLATQNGDGTGYGDCFDFHDGQYICSWFGNHLPRIEAMFVGPAQNVFILTNNPRCYPNCDLLSLWKLSPDGVFQSIASDLSSLGGHIGRVDAAVLSSLGTLYLADTGQNLLLRVTPLPVGTANEFTFDEPHAQLIHSAAGIGPVPVGYSLVEQSQSPILDKQAAHLDTRNPTFAHIDWTKASREVSVVEFEGEPAEQVRETISDSAHSYRRETVTTTDTIRRLRSIDYYRDSEIVLAVSGLQLPELFFRSLPNHRVMSWLLGGNNIFEGGALNDVIEAYAGHDVLYGQAGDDLLIDGPGADLYYGGEGQDRVIFSLPKDYYHVSRDPVDGSTTVKVKVGQGDPYVDWLSSDIEQIEFSDALINTSALVYFGDARTLSSDPIELPDAESAVYRFFNARTQAFFYTPTIAERDAVLRNSGPDNQQIVDWPYIYQGAKFRAAHSYGEQSPLYRFYNTRTGHHFFTVDEEERDLVRDKIASGEWSFVDEGVAFSVYSMDPNPFFEGQETPVYRFFNPILGRHVFTTSEHEAANFRLSADWQDEGIGFWAESL